MYQFKFAAIYRTDQKNNIHHFSTIADSEGAARRQFSGKFVLFSRLACRYPGVRHESAENERTRTG